MKNRLNKHQNTMRKLILSLIAIVLGAVALYAEYPVPHESMSGKWGYINSVGQMVIRPRYDSALPFREGMAAVEQRGKWGFVNLQGRQVCKCVYQEVRDFNYGYALVKKDGKWGAINEDGELIVPCENATEGDLVKIKTYLKENARKKQ